MVPRLRIVVVDDHEIFRRGVVACLSEDPGLEVRASTDDGGWASADVAVVSPEACLRHSFPCPVVVCGNPAPADGSDVAPNDPVAYLPRKTVTSDQLVAAVRAAAVGLRVEANRDRVNGGGIDDRGREVLRLLSEGADTQRIAFQLSYSQRTIKGLIYQLQGNLGASTRAEVVAIAIRRGLI